MKLTYKLLDATDSDLEMIIQAVKETLELESRHSEVNIENIKEAIKNKEIKLVVNKTEKLGFFWVKLNYSISYFENIFYVQLTYLKNQYRKFFYRFVLEAIKDYAKENGYNEIFGDVFHSNIESFKMHSKLAEPVYTVFRATI
ncbi:MAG: hypothetical protein ACM3KR_03965 [Deltaproteobacteria bacterium]